VLIVDSLTQRIVEANPAAAGLLEEDAAALVNRSFTELFNVEGQLNVQALLAGRRAGAKAEEARVRLSHSKRDIAVSVAMFRQEGAGFFLVRLSSGPAPQAGPPDAEPFADLAASAADAMVVTTADSRVVAANRSFLELAELVNEEQARGQGLDRWLGRIGVDMDVLMANLRQRGAVRLFTTVMRGEYGASADVELSATALDPTAGDEKSRSYGFIIRDVGRRVVQKTTAGIGLPRSVEQLTELIGRVSLKELVRDSTDMIERLCIEAALQVTNDNRASAAEMLGLSRQSLYVKLRRYGLGDLDDEVNP
jgi:transcriptional regulator PpsR